MSTISRLAYAMYLSRHNLTGKDVPISTQELYEGQRAEYERVVRDVLVEARAPSEGVEDSVRGAWLWYSRLPYDNKWTLGEQNNAGGFNLSLTPDEAAATHLPKHIMGRISWRTQIDAILSDAD